MIPQQTHKQCSAGVESLCVHFLLLWLSLGGTAGVFLYVLAPGCGLVDQSSVYCNSPEPARKLCYNVGS